MESRTEESPEDSGTVKSTALPDTANAYYGSLTTEQRLELMETALRIVKGDLNAVARLLNINERAIYKRLRTLGLDRNGFRGTYKSLSEEGQREFMVRVMEEAEGNVKAAALGLGLTRQAVAYRLKVHKLNPKDYAASATAA